MITWVLWYPGLTLNFEMKYNLFFQKTVCKKRKNSVILGKCLSVLCFFFLVSQDLNFYWIKYKIESHCTSLSINLKNVISEVKYFKYGYFRYRIYKYVRLNLYNCKAI